MGPSVPDFRIRNFKAAKAEEDRVPFFFLLIDPCQVSTTFSSRNRQPSVLFFFFLHLLYAILDK